MEVNSAVPFGLYKLTALLVKEEFIDLDSMWVVCARFLVNKYSESSIFIRSS